MTIVIVDGIEIETTNWIDANIGKFKNENEYLPDRRGLISKEIDMRKADIQRFEPGDPRGRAHPKAYIQELERLDKDLARDCARDALAAPLPPI